MYLRGFLALILCTGPILAQFAPGTTQEKVTCISDPAKSYALFLPSAYREDRKWPLLFCLDPRGRGMLPLKLFEAAAEEYGFLLACSNDFLSDGPVEPSWDAIRAVWEDVLSRFSVDPGRLYAAGFSGGARMAWVLADYSEYPFAGIIGVGGGLPWADLRNSLDGSRLAFYGITGTTDFNYYEMQELDRRLDIIGIPHYFSYFEGTHSWPPPEFAKGALDWLQTEAALRSPAADQAESWRRVSQSRLDRARTLEQEGDWIAARAELVDVMRQERALGLPVPDLREQLQKVVNSTGLKTQVKKRERSRREYWQEMQRVSRILTLFRARDPALLELKRLLGELKLDGLKKKARSSEPESSRAAQRVLESIRTDATFYIAREMEAAGDYSRLEISLRLGLELEPETWFLWFRLAETQAHLHKEEAALASLEQARALGMNRPELLQDNVALSSLSQDPRFQRLLEDLLKQSPLR